MNNYSEPPNINGVAGENRKCNPLFRQWQRGALSFNSVIDAIILQIFEKNADPEMTLLVYLRRHCNGGIFCLLVSILYSRINW